MKGIKRIAQWSAKYVWLFVAIVLLSSLLQWLYSYLPLFVQYVFEVLEDKAEFSKVALPSFILDWYKTSKDVLVIILMVSASMVILQAGRSILRFIDNYWQGALSQYIGYDLKIKIYNHVCDLPMSYHNHADLGDLIQRSTSDVDQVSTFVSQQVPNFINIFVTVGIGAYQVARISPTLMWVSIIIVPFTAIASIIYWRQCNKQFETIENAESKMTTVIQENVNGARVVRAFANEKYEFDKMDKANADFANKSGKFNNMMAIFWGSSDFSVFLQYAATLIVGIILAKNGELSSSDIVATLLLMGMLIWPMRGLGRIVASFGKASVAAKRIGEMLDEKSEFIGDSENKPEIKGDIAFEHVSFKFPDDTKNLLNDVSFNVKQGQTIALVGKTGSGKSTICNILTRMLDYQAGSVKLDGNELNSINKKHVRSNIRYVLQDPFLFSKTVYENISIVNNKISEDQVYEAARTAAIHDEVMKFEKGYKTIVGEKGTTLSGGQKQRVAIARMLIDESPIIIFDDSLSALDTKTDVEIRKALKEKNSNQTVFIITHRTTTAKEADMILVLDEGKIVQQGTHEELVKQTGLYSNLWGIQGELEKEFIDVLKGVN